MSARALLNAAENRVGAAVVPGVGFVPGWKSNGLAVRRRRAHGVTAYVGANGAGKSLMAANDTIPTLRGVPWACDNPDHRHTVAGQTTGVRRVLSTMRFTTPAGDDHPLWVPLDDYDRLLTAEHVDVVLDEAGGAVGSSSTSADDVPAPVKAALQEQRRKDNLVRLTAPGWMRITKSARECVSLVTMVMGFKPEPHRYPIRFPGPHEVERFDFRTSQLVVEVCGVDREHEHDAGRLWGARRLMVARSYDARLFEEWTTEKKNRLRPEVRQLFWRPGSLAERVYDTFAAVEKLGSADVCGICFKPHRVVRYCEGHDSDGTRRARRRAHLLAAVPDSLSEPSKAADRGRVLAAGPDTVGTPQTPGPG